MHTIVFTVGTDLILRSLDELSERPSIALGSSFVLTGHRGRGYVKG